MTRRFRRGRGTMGNSPPTGRTGDALLFHRPEVFVEPVECLTDEPVEVIGNVTALEPDKLLVLERSRSAR
jgi:hypothetical protein